MKNYKEEYCIAICPSCGEDGGGGLLYVEKNDKTQQMYICCDECLLDFPTPTAAFDDTNWGRLRYNLQDSKRATLKEIEAKGWLDFIYVWENDKWLKYKDKTQKLF